MRMKCSFVRMAAGLLCCLAIMSVHAAGRNPLKVACVGNSITFGATIPNRESNSYPAQLQAWLGEGYEVRNFGYSGSTVIRRGDYQYAASEAHSRSLEFQPDIVVMKLGTNDAQLHMWPHIDAFKTDYQFILDSYLQLPSRPRIILVTPLKCFFPPDGKYNNERLQEVGRMVKEIALENSLECVDLFDLPDDGEPAVLMPDKLHPSSIGAGRMAARIGAVIAPQLAALPASIHAVPGNEFRSGAGWVQGVEWHAVAGDIVRTLQGKRLKLLLLGNSITQGWGGNRQCVAWKPGKAAMDEVLGANTWESAGISGDRTQNLLWRLKHDGYNCCEPKNVVIAIGINNLVEDKDLPDDVAAGIVAVTEEAEKLFPHAHIILLGLLPSGKEPDSDIRQQCDAVHAALGRHTFAKASYCNPTPWFLAADGSIRTGLYSSDYVHLSEEGYRVMAAHLKALLRQ